MVKTSLKDDDRDRLDHKDDDAATRRNADHVVMPTFRRFSACEKGNPAVMISDSATERM